MGERVEELTKSFFGSFGVWLLGAVGTCATTAALFVVGMLWRIRPRIEKLEAENREKDLEIEALSARLQMLRTDIAADIARVNATITHNDDLTRRSLEAIAGRIDALIGGQNNSYQQLSAQIMDLQQAIIEQR